MSHFNGSSVTNVEILRDKNRHLIENGLQEGFATVLFKERAANLIGVV